MADAIVRQACTCCKSHAGCCSCWTKQEIGWTKSFQNVPEFVPATWADWLTSGGKKQEGDKSWKFFKEGYVFDIYVGQIDGFDKLFFRARSYRSLRKNEDAHYLYLVVSEKDSKASVDCAIALA